MIAADLQSLLEMAPDPTVVVDRGVRITAASESAARLLGRPLGELLGVPISEHVRGGVLDPGANLTACRPDGTEFPAEISVRVIEIDGESSLAVAIRDVTERRLRAASLREAGERFKRLFEDGPVAMALVGDDFLLGEVNAAFCELTGYSAEELRELHLQRHHPPRRPRRRPARGQGGAGRASCRTPRSTSATCARTASWCGCRSRCRPSVARTAGR